MPADHLLRRVDGLRDESQMFRWPQAAIDGMDRGEEAYHGRSGPLKVGPTSSPHPLADVFIKAGQQVGIP